MQRFDFTGVIYSNIKIDTFLGNGMWDCICLLCGKHRTIYTGDINRSMRNRRDMSCRECSYENRNVEDLRNKVFGKLTVLNLKSIRKYGIVYWRCICDCGNKAELEIRASHLKAGTIKSCGCLLTKRKGNDYDLNGNFGIGYTSKKEEFYFDLDDFEKIKNYTWYKDACGYLETRGDAINTSIYLHRIITECEQGLSVDHINRNPSDNRKENLRICSHMENMHNRKLNKNNKSGVAGVFKLNKKWSSKISVNYNNINLGRFNTFEEAVTARLLFELEFFGIQFAPQRNLFEEYGIK